MVIENEKEIIMRPGQGITHTQERAIVERNLGLLKELVGLQERSDLSVDLVLGSYALSDTTHYSLLITKDGLVERYQHVDRRMDSDNAGADSCSQDTRSPAEPSEDLVKEYKLDDQNLANLIAQIKG